jgi:NADPH:quinone reductase-like Zn-dependent oxidoreductase
LPDVLKCEEVQKPTAADDQVLIKVCAASANPLDWHLMRGTPHVGRIMTGLRKPKMTRPGVDVAGRVEAAGGRVTQFKPGDEVFGSCRGAFAEYACAPESALVAKPGNVTFEQAASAPVAAFTALQGLRDEDLTIIRELMTTGKVTPVIDRRYRLSDVPEAIRYLAEGHARGKVVITVE